jgi:hypothetical protein
MPFAWRMRHWPIAPNNKNQAGRLLPLRSFIGTVLLRRRGGAWAGMGMGMGMIGVHVDVGGAGRGVRLVVEGNGRGGRLAEESELQAVVNVLWRKGKGKRGGGLVCQVEPPGMVMEWNGPTRLAAHRSRRG